MKKLLTLLSLIGFIGVVTATTVGMTAFTKKGSNEKDITNEVNQFIENVKKDNNLIIYPNRPNEAIQDIISKDGVGNLLSKEADLSIKPIEIMPDAWIKLNLKSGYTVKPGTQLEFIVQNKVKKEDINIARTTIKNKVDEVAKQLFSSHDDALNKIKGIHGKGYKITSANIDDNSKKYSVTATADNGFTIDGSPTYDFGDSINIDTRENITQGVKDTIKEINKINNVSPDNLQSTVESKIAPSLKDEDNQNKITVTAKQNATTNTTADITITYDEKIYKVDPSVSLTFSVENAIDATEHIKIEKIQKDVDKVVKDQTYKSNELAKQAIQNVDNDKVTIVVKNIDDKGYYTATATAKSGYTLDGHDLHGKVLIDNRENITSGVNETITAIKTIQQIRLENLQSTVETKIAASLKDIDNQNKITVTAKQNATTNTTADITITYDDKKYIINKDTAKALNFSVVNAIDTRTRIQLTDIQKEVYNKTKNTFNSEAEARTTIEAVDSARVTISNVTFDKGGNYTAKVEAKPNFVIDGGDKLQGKVNIDTRTDITKDVQDTIAAINTINGVTKDQLQKTVDEKISKVVKGEITVTATQDSKINTTADIEITFDVKKYKVDESKVQLTFSVANAIDTRTIVHIADVQAKVDSAVKNQTFDSQEKASAAIIGADTQEVTISNVTFDNDGNYTATATAKDHYNLVDGPDLHGKVNIDTREDITQGVKDTIASIQQIQQIQLKDLQKTAESKIVTSLKKDGKNIITVNATQNKSTDTTADITISFDKTKYKVDESKVQLTFSVANAIDTRTIVHIADVQAKVDSAVKDQKFDSKDAAIAAIVGADTTEVTISDVIFDKDGKSFTATATAKDHYNLIDGNQVHGTVNIDTREDITQGVKDTIVSIQKIQKIKSVDLQSTVESKIVTSLKKDGKNIITVTATQNAETKTTADITISFDDKKYKVSKDTTLTFSVANAIDDSNHISINKVKKDIDAALAGKTFYSSDEVKKVIEGVDTTEVKITVAVKEDGSYSGTAKANDGYTLDDGNQLSGRVNITQAITVDFEQIKKFIDEWIAKNNNKFNSGAAAQSAIMKDFSNNVAATFDLKIDNDGNITGAATAKPGYIITHNQSITGKVILNKKPSVKTANVQKDINDAVNGKTFKTSAEATTAIQAVDNDKAIITVTVNDDGTYTGTVTAKPEFILEGNGQLSGKVTIDPKTHISTVDVQADINKAINGKTFKTSAEATTTIQAVDSNEVKITVKVNENGTYTGKAVAIGNYALDGDGVLKGKVTIDPNTHISTVEVQADINKAINGKTFDNPADAKKAIEAVDKDKVKITVTVNKDGTYTGTAVAQKGFTLDGTGQLSGNVTIDDRKLIHTKDIQSDIDKALADRGFKTEDDAEKAIEAVDNDVVTITVTITVNDDVATYTGKAVAKPGYKLDDDGSLKGKTTVDGRVHYNIKDIQKIIDEETAGKTYGSIKEAKKAIHDSLIKAGIGESTIEIEDLKIDSDGNYVGYADPRWGNIVDGGEIQSKEAIYNKKVSGKVNFKINNINSDEVKKFATELIDQKWSNLPLVEKWSYNDQDKMDYLGETFEYIIKQYKDSLKISYSIEGDTWTLQLSANKGYTIVGEKTISGTLSE
ncbi:hypothetical protein [Spiroplasma endosymbiont of Crioceris asparagi]|uniref:hypothetical protein n=1 Tax=Spiroplasma endosymbiont of Crioceris asparagi TaxID=3066286 RepID=UPI0030CF31AA